MNSARSLDAMWEQNNEWAVKEGGCRILSILDIGYRQLTTSAKHPVRKLADAKGIKIRTPQNALMVSTFKALGLEPTAVSFCRNLQRAPAGRGGRSGRLLQQRGDPEVLRSAEVRDP